MALRRRAIMGLIASLRIVILVVLAVLAGQPIQAQDRPNILFFLSDDQRHDQLGTAGHPILETPTLDRLAAEGIRFRNAFVTTSICAASRASILTGLHQRSHRFTFGTPPIASTLTDQSYPRRLRQAGYRTGFIGKWGVEVEAGVIEELFDLFEPLDRNPYFKEQSDGSRRHISQIAGDRAIEFLRTHDARQPFALSVSFNAPHAEDDDKEDHYPWPVAVDGLYDEVAIPASPLSDPAVFESQPEFLKTSLNRDRWFWRWDTPEKYQTNIRGYYRMISGVDLVVGRVLDEVERLGLAEKTVVIFASDNGCYLGSRGFAGKWSHYEESLRVPLIILDPRPRDVDPGQVVSEMALNIDIPPTILDLAGVDVPPTYQGRSLVSFVRGERPDVWRTDFFAEHLMHYPGGIPKWEGVRAERWVYARYFEQSPVYEFLHDLERDPQQLQNLAGDPDHQDDLARMRRRTDELRDAYGGPYSLERFPSTAGQTTMPAPPMRPPNVVLIISDDQAWTDFGFMGHQVIQTPNLDQLAAEGALFTRGYVPTALCRPSLASIITGLYPHQYRITGNDPAVALDVQGSEYWNDPRYRELNQHVIGYIDAVPTLPRLLAERGYLSFQAGKWWEGHHGRGGFTAGLTHGDADRGGRHGDEGLNIGRFGLRPIFDFIDGAGDQPFFVWYAPFLPHTPHTPPQRLLEQYAQPGRPIEIARYYAMCAWLDETVGELLEYLAEHELDETTVVAFVTDNGWIQRSSLTNAPPYWNQMFAPRSKQSPYEGGVRTPIMLRWPGVIPPVRLGALASSLDLAPTILAAAGVDAPDDMPGLNLLDLANGVAVERDAIFGEGFAHDIADVDDPTQSLLYRWCIDGRWKLILSYDGSVSRYEAVHRRTDNLPELYDLAADPHETRNVAEDNPEIVARLSERVAAWWPADTEPRN